MRRISWWPVLCVLLTIAAVCATGPILEMGLNDDWSFAHIALRTSSTGVLSYNGWAAPLLGLHVWVGAALISLFGFSFTLLRLSTLPFAAGCGLLMYQLARRSGAAPAVSSFAALSLTLSPVFLPLATSYMSDVPALFFWLAAIYCAERAATDRSDKYALWLSAATLAGFGGGTIRQVVWAVPALAIPAVAWLRRRDRRTLGVALLLWCALAAAVAICLRWYDRQPGHQPLPTVPLRDAVTQMDEPLRLMAVSCMLLLLPILSLYITRWRQWRRSWLCLTTGILAAGTLVVASLWWYEDDLLLGNMVTPFGILWRGSDAMGDKAVVIDDTAQTILASILVLAAGFAAGGMFRIFRDRDGLKLPPLGPYLAVALPACAAYAAAVSFRYTIDEILFDRYVLFIAAPLTIPLVSLYNTAVARSPSPLACIVLTVLAVFGVCATHDYIASARARLQAARMIMASGVPRTKVSAGLEFDGWTQLEQTGQIPPLEIRKRDSRSFPVADPYWFWRMTPTVDPRYCIVYSPIAGLRDSQFPPIEYRLWLPPFHRRVLVQTMP